MQWLIDLVAERVIATIGIPPVYINRGDPAATDFDQTDFVEDSTWRELDLSAIVPAGAQAVDISLFIRNTLVGKTAFFRRNGNVNGIAVASARTQVANQFFNADLVCPVDSDRKINYNFTAGGVWTAGFTIKGWWL